MEYRQTTIKKKLELRALILDGIRRFFRQNDYLEVETPLRIPAPAPETFIDAEPSGTWYLHTSPELCMKRLLAAGYPKIFQTTRCFRKNERGDRHLPELTLLEWYTAGGNYLSMMDQCEELIISLAQDLDCGREIFYKGRQIDLTPPWERLSVKDAFDTHASESMETCLENDCFDEIMALEIEPNLGNKAPLFLYDYPESFASLAKRKPGEPKLAERFELYIGGIEICNAFSELTDADEQRRRFKAEMKIRRSLGKDEYPLPENFLAALKHMPEATGNALGLDRLVMLFADTDCIDDVVAFTPEEL